MGGCGGGQTKSSNRFRRAGTTKSSSRLAVPAFLETLLSNNAQRGDTTETLGTAQNTFLEGLLANDFKSPPGLATLQNNINVDPTTFTGKSAMSAVANVNPFDQNFKAGYETLFKDLFSKAAAAGRTGPDAVRGGTAHGGFVAGDVLERGALDMFREITGLQQKQAEVTTSAGSAVNAVENSRRAVSMAGQDNWVKQWLQGLTSGLGGASEITKRRAVNTEALTSLASILGSKSQDTTDNLVGEGSQESSQFGWGAGLNCCFIFLEALNGKLPWYVRRGRDLFCEPGRVAGYKRMAAWLVPAMRRSKLVRWAVNTTMVRPFLTCGRWYFGDDVTRTGRALGFMSRPICEVWFKTWDVLGGKVMYG